MSPQENSEAAKRELCARFDAFVALLEEKKTELLGRIGREQEDKTGFVQGLIHKYKEQLEKSSRLVETAIQAMEETGEATFLMVRPRPYSPLVPVGCLSCRVLVARGHPRWCCSDTLTFFLAPTERQAAH